MQNDKWHSAAGGSVARITVFEELAALSLFVGVHRFKD